MAKQINVSLAFTADASQAKAQMQDLQNSLTKLMQTTSESGGGLGLTKDIVSAKGAVADLKVALQNATSASGGLDLSKFSESMTKSGMTVEQYRMKLEKLGPAGSEAFLKLSQSIISAEAPLKRTNTLLDNFKTSLANTARWQISSSVLHGFMGALQSAYGYAQDLNESLTNIQIVSGQTSEQMADFAERANQAAQALSTTTTTYTDAALIFYQQGLDNDAVEERTNATIKMAQATGDSATAVSSYMTAIWNNFDDGSESLEHYADVITNLGAHTASSSSEIAEGLSKFASVAQTAGLSYEYATSALATVVAETRQSADTVGTAFKTLFARIQDLELGDTLEDGTTLGSYSQALEKVGVNIKDTSGELKSMDSILDELGEKWNTLSDDTKIATAQAVAGTRQYTQLMALMNNWDEFQTNLGTAKSADGTLDKQADTYAESWEAARDRVKASAEAIYSDLLDDKFFITLLNSVNKVLQGVDGLIDGMGGLKTIIPGVLALVTKLYGSSMAKSLDNMIFNVQRLTKSYKEQQNLLRERFAEEAEKVNAETGTELGDAKTNSLKIQNQLSKELYEASEKLSAEAIKELQYRMDIVKTYRDQVEAAAEARDKAIQGLQDTRQDLVNKTQRKNNDPSAARGKLSELQTLQTAATKAQISLNELNTSFKNGDKSLQKYEMDLLRIKKNLLDAGFSKTSKSVQSVNKAIKEAQNGGKDFNQVLKELTEEGKFADSTFADVDSAAIKLRDTFDWSEEETDAFCNKVKELTEAQIQEKDAIKTAAEAIQEFHDKVQEASQAANSLGTTGQTIIQVAQGISQVAMGFSAAANVFDTLTDPDLSGLEKFKNLLISLPMAITMIGTGMKSLITTFSLVNAATKAITLATNENTLSEAMNSAAKSNNVLITLAASAAAIAKTGSTNMESIAEAGLTTNLLAQAAAWMIVHLHMLPVVAVLTVLAIAIGAVVFAGVGLVKLFKAIEAASPEGQLKSAKEEAESLKDALEDVKSEAEELETAFDNYDSIQEKLESATKGTQEWRDALAEANTNVLELINTYPELASALEGTAETGYSINEDAIEKAKDNSTKKVNAVTAAESAAESNVRDKQLVIDTNSFTKELSQNLSSVGDLIDSSYGGYIDNNQAAMKTLAQNADKLSGLGGTDLANEIQEVLNDAGYNMSDAAAQQWADEISESGLLEGFSTLAASIDANTAATDASNQIIASNELADDSKVQNSKYAEDIIEASGNLYGSLYDQKYEEQLKKTTSRGAFNTGTEDSITAWQEYAELMGLDADSVTNYKGNGNDASVVYKDEDGEEQEVSAKTMAAALAAAEATESLGASADALVDKFNELGSSANVADQGLMSFLTSQNFDGATYSEFMGSKGMVQDRRNQITDQSVSEYLGAEFGGEDKALDDSEAQAYGYESASAMIEAYKTGIENATEAWNDAKSFDEFDMLDDKVTENMSLETAQALKQQFEDIDLGPLGESGGKQYVSGLNSILSKYNEEDQQTILDTLANADWTDWDVAMSEIPEQLSELGIDIDEDSEEWIKFAENMRVAAGALQDFSSVASNASTAIQYMDSGAGTEISMDDYNTLLTMFPELSAHVIQVDSDTVKLTDDFANFAASDISDLYSQMNDYYELQQQILDSGDLSSQIESAANAEAGTDEGDAALNSAFEALQSDASGSQLLETLGYTDERLQDMTGKTDDIQVLMETVQQFLSMDYSTEGLQEQLASSFDNFKDLNEALEEGSIDVEAYNKAADALHNTLDEDIDEEQYEDLADHIQEVAESSDDLADSLKTDEKAAKKVSSSLLRYDSALEDISDNYDDWMDALESGDMEEQVEVGKKLKNVYADMLDLDMDSLSDDFATNADNLKLMKQAANGSEEAYEELQAAAAKDILTQCGIDTTQFDADKSYIENTIATKDGGMLSDLEVGATIDDTNFISGLEDMVNAAGMTADQATSYLASMGVDAEVETVKSTANDTHQYSGAQAHVTTQSVSSVDPLSGDPVTYDIPSITYTSVPLQTDETKEDTAFALKVTSAKKSSGGGFKYNNSSNGAGSRRSSGGGSGGGGGGSGSGSTAEYNRQAKKNPTDEKERYHVVNNQLEDLQAQYDKVAEAKDRAFGKSKLKLMDQEISKQKQLIAKQKEYLAQIKANLALDKSNLANGTTTYSDENGNTQTVASGANNYLGMSVNYDENGTITNYDALVDAAVAKYNAAVETFNQATTDDDAAKLAFEAAEKQYEGFMAFMDQYDETQDLVKDKEQEIIDAENELYDEKLAKTQYVVELKIMVNDADLDLMDYYIDKLSDNAYEGAKTIGYLGNAIEDVIGKASAYKDGLAEIFSNHGLDGDSLVARLANGEDLTSVLGNENFTEDEMDSMRDYVSNLLEANENLEDYRAQVFETLQNIIDENNDKMDKAIEKVQHFQKLMQNHANIIDIVGRKTLGVTSEMMKALNDAQVTTAINNITTNYAKKNMLEQELADARAKRAAAEAAGLEKDVEYWDDIVDGLEEDLDEAEEDSLQALEDALQAARDAFDSTTTAIVDDFSTAIGGLAGSIEALQEQMDQQKEIEEEYLPDYERVYELTKLTRNISNSIDETSNVKAKRELLKLQEEINDLQESGKDLSEYDLEYLQKRYELKVAEMQLEEAQNAKSQVRMTQDSEGNYSYVYTADDQAVADAEQNYEDKLYEMQQLNADYINELQDSMVELENEQAEKIAELADLYEIGSVEYENALKDLQSNYSQQLSYYSEQMDNVITNNKDLYENDVVAYAELTDNKAMLDEEYIDDFGDTQLAIQTGYETLEELQLNWDEAAGDMYQEVADAANDYEAQNAAAFEAAGYDIETYAQTMETEVDAMKTQSEELAGSMDDMSKTAVEDYQEISEKVSEFESQYSATIDNIIGKNEKVVESFNKLLEAWAGVEAKENSYDNSSSDGSDGSSGGDGSGGSGGESGSGDNSDKAEGVAAAIWIYGTRSGWGNGSERSSKLAAKGVSGAQSIINSGGPSGQLYNSWWGRRGELSNYFYGSFDTGGYTGDWNGEDGKFAMLHQKEIVLNKEDTENFLNAVDMVRQIAGIIDLNAVSASGGLGAMLASSISSNNKETLEQEVNITAEFPNVSSKTEILEAFDNVINLASQYANRKV